MNAAATAVRFERLSNSMKCVKWPQLYITLLYRHFQLLYMYMTKIHIYSFTYKTNTHRAPNAISYYTASILHHVSNNSWTSKNMLQTTENEVFMGENQWCYLCVDVVGGKSIVKFFISLRWERVAYFTNEKSPFIILTNNTVSDFSIYIARNAWIT